jgi:hypothetical protein
MMKVEDVGISVLALAPIAAVIAGVASYVTHLWWIISLLMVGDVIAGGKIVLAVLGVIFFPLGCLHGVYLWFNPW